MATWNDQIPERQDRILQMIYGSVARHVGLHQQCFIGSARPVANPHKGDLDDLTESVGQERVQGEIRVDNQVVNKVDLDLNLVIDRDNVAQADTQVIDQDNDQVDIQVNDLSDDQIDDQGNNQGNNQDNGQVDDEVEDMAQLQTTSDNGLTSTALLSHTFRSRLQQHTPGVGQPKTRKGQNKDEAEDMVTLYLK